MAGGVDDDRTGAFCKRLERVGETPRAPPPRPRAAEWASVRTDMSWGLARSLATLPPPSAPVFDVVRETPLRKSRSMVATLWPAFSKATAICMATVDLPEPPFSVTNDDHANARRTGRRSLNHSRAPLSRWKTWRCLERYQLALIRAISAIVRRFSGASFLVDTQDFRDDSKELRRLKI